MPASTKPVASHAKPKRTFVVQGPWPRGRDSRAEAAGGLDSAAEPLGPAGRGPRRRGARTKCESSRPSFFFGNVPRAKGPAGIGWESCFARFSRPLSQNQSPNFPRFEVKSTNCLLEGPSSGLWNISMLRASQKILSQASSGYSEGTATMMAGRGMQEPRPTLHGRCQFLSSWMRWQPIAAYCNTLQPCTNVHRLTLGITRAVLLGDSLISSVDI